MARVRLGYRQTFLCGCEVRVLHDGIDIHPCRPHAQSFSLRDVLTRAYPHIPAGLSVLRADVERVLAEAGSPLPAAAGAGLVAHVGPTPKGDRS